MAEGDDDKAFLAEQDAKGQANLKASPLGRMQRKVGRRRAIKKAGWLAAGTAAVAVTAAFIAEELGLTGPSFEDHKALFSNDNMTKLHALAEKKVLYVDSPEYAWLGDLIIRLKRTSPEDDPIECVKYDDYDRTILKPILQVAIKSGNSEMVKRIVFDYQSFMTRPIEGYDLLNDVKANFPNKSQFEKTQLTDYLLAMAPHTGLPGR